MKPFLIFGLYNDYDVQWDGMSNLDADQADYCKKTITILADKKDQPTFGDALAMCMWRDDDDFITSVMDIEKSKIPDHCAELERVFRIAEGDGLHHSELCEHYGIGKDHEKYEESMLYHSNLNGFAASGVLMMVGVDAWRFKDGKWYLQSKKA